MAFRERFAGWFVPSNWVAWLKGNKRILGGFSLFLYVLIYIVPTLAPQYGWVGGIGAKLRDFLLGLGLELSDELLVGGTGLTIVGLFDWILNYGPTRVTSKALRTVEKPFVPEPDDSDGGLHAQ